MQSHQHEERRILRWPEVHARVKKSRAQVWRDIKAGRFPQPVELGPNSIGWYEHEIAAYQEGRPRRTYGAASEADAPRAA